MKKIAYIITKDTSGELLESCLLSNMGKRPINGQISALFFVGEGIYHLVKGSRSANKIKEGIQNLNIKVVACEHSVKSRNMETLLINGIKIGTISDFYAVAEDVDHIMSL
ncbi:MAG: DsrE family protein [candidate division KSB1 bacterium]|nr:DsrE family protein [candidate division KSB1 bacterium]